MSEKVTSLKSAVSLSETWTRQLLSAITRAADTSLNLADRRLSVLASLQEMAGAHAGYWAWGHGDGSANSIIPVALIDFGFTPQQLGTFVTVAMAPEVHQEFVEPIRRMKGELAQIALVRKELFEDLAWKKSYFAQQLNQLGFDDWLHCVRYSCEDTWSQLFLLRVTGAAPFQAEDRLLIDTAMSSVSWLHSTPAEVIPQSRLVGLTPRQRAVLFMLLNGLSRKQIASRFLITEQTVGDHIKQIYRHFSINSAGELAAMFLRGKQ